MSDSSRRIAENLALVRERIGAAIRQAGRQPADVTLVAVTKYVGLTEIAALVEAGCTELGESRPQTLWDKAQSLSSLPIAWHFIGHLQRNKAARTVAIAELIHSADTWPLLTAIDTAARGLGRISRVLLEVNVSGDVAKHGLAPDEVEPLLARLPELANVEVRGLMTMASATGGLDTARRNFAALRTLRDRLGASAPPEISLTELSMGMSGDYEVAIAEGATIVRVGSALFEGLDLGDPE